MTQSILHRQPPQMKHSSLRRSGRCSFKTVVVLSILFLCLDPAKIFSGQIAVTDSAPALDAFPIANRSYKAHVGSHHLTGRVEEKIILFFTLDPPQVPQGFFLSVNLKQIKAPEKKMKKNPEILTGFPDTRLTFHDPGIYTYAVIVSMIAKSSCGGVNADTVFNGDIHIDVSE